MNSQHALRSAMVGGILLSSMSLVGCGTVGGVMSDIGFAGAGGAAGYDLSDGKVGGAAAGAAAGYLVSRVAQSEVRRTIAEAEQRGYERAMNQAVKQQYWIIQNQQKLISGDGDDDTAYVPVVIPESTIDGVTYNARIEYVRISQ